MLEYSVLKNSIDRDEFYLRRNYGHDEYTKINEAQNDKRRRIEEIRNNTPPIIIHNGETISFDSDMPMLEGMQNTLAKDKYSNSRVLDSYKKMEKQLEAALSQLGLTAEYESYEQEAYFGIDRKVLSVYNILERMYPLYPEDDE